jgi:hypothetical protein
MIFLYSFLIFVAFITLLIGGASVVMGTINKDRGWVLFGFKALLITLLAFIICSVFLWPHLKTLGAGLHNFLRSFK